MRQAPKGHKYRARAIVVDGHKFPSQAEAARYVWLSNDRTITELHLQPRFDLHGPNGRKVARYTADFDYRQGGERIIEDVKGVKTRELRSRLKHVKDEYGVEVRLVKMDPDKVKSILEGAVVEGRVTCGVCGVKLDGWNMWKHGVIVTCLKCGRAEE